MPTAKTIPPHCNQFTGGSCWPSITTPRARSDVPRSFAVHGECAALIPVEQAQAWRVNPLAPGPGRGHIVR